MANEKIIKSRQQQKYDIAANWEKATGFKPLAGELIIYSDLNKIKIGDGVNLVNDLPFFISGGSESFDGEIIESTPETLSEDIARAGARSIIVLTTGQYDRIRLIGKDSYAENLTFVGQDGAEVAGVEISSGIISDTIHSNSDISDAILPEGLTFRNIKFTGNFSQKNSRVNNLTIDGCTFAEKCNIFVNPEGFSDSYSSEIYSSGAPTDFGFTYRYPYCQVNQTNLVVKNCTIADGSTFIDPNGKSVASAIHVLGVKDVTLTYNEIGGGYNGIQVSGAESDYNVVAGGKIFITKNIVKNTSSRGINIASVHSGEVVIAENTLSNINHKDKIISRYFKDTTITYVINGVYHQPNTCDGEAISTTTGGVVEQDITVKTNNYDYNPKTYIVASSSKLLEVLPTVEAGATIKLKSGNYKLLTLSGNKSYPENLTIIGEDGATFAGITITSGVRPEDGIDMDLVVMPKGLTLKNLTFTNKLNIINCEISDLSIIDCRFGENAFINCRASAFDAGGTRKGANETFAHNVLVKGCTFATDTTRQYGIYLQAADSAVFEDNTIDGAAVNGILVSGIYGNDKLSCGKFIARNNTISNTASEGIKFWFLKDASLYIQNNTLTSSSETKGILANNCASTTISADGNILNGEALAITESSVSSPADYIKNQIGLAAALKEKADKTDLDSKMDEGVLIYNGINDTDETGLNNWLDNTVMPSMANDTIRNISVRVGGKNGDGKGIIPWPALGTIHKRTSAYATIDVTAQINGKHYTKYRTDGKWSATACIEDKINLKADKSAMEAALANKADKADIENLSGNEVAIFDPSIEGGEDHPPVVMDWLDNKIIPSMTDNSIKYIYIPEAGFFYDTSAFNTLYELIGTVYKFDNNNIMINVFQADGTNIIKTKLNGAWKNPKNSQSVLNEKVSAVADVYKSVDDTDETKLNSWLETISDYSRGDFCEFLGMQDGSTKFISVNTPAVADGVLLWGTLYKHSYDSMTIDFISQEDGKRHIKIKTNGVWQDTLAISNSGQQDPGSNSETITNPQEMTEKELETWLEQEVLPIMADGSIRNILIRSSNLFDSYFGTKQDELGVGTIYKRDNDYVVLDLVSVFSGRHITKVKSPDYPSYTNSDSGQGVWKNHMSITPYEYANAELECYTREWDESKINNWLENIGYDMTSNNTSPSIMGYPTYIRNIEILYGPDGNRLIGTIYSHSLLDSDKTVHLTDYNTGKQYVKRRYMGTWGEMQEFGGITEEYLDRYMEEYNNSVLMQTYLNNDAFSHAQSDKLDCFPQIFRETTSTDETKLNTWLSNLANKLNSWSGGNKGIQNVYISTPSVASGKTLMGLMYLDGNNNATVNLTAVGTDERYVKVMLNNVWQDTTKVESSGGGMSEAEVQVALDSKLNKSLVSYHSDNDADETNFNAWLDALLAGMTAGSVLGVKVNCYPAINGVTLFGMLYKHDATNLYATLTLSTYAAGTYKKIKTNGNWLDAAALSDVAFTFTNGTLEIKTTF